MRKVVLILLVLLVSTMAYAQQSADLELSWTAPTTNEDGSPLTDLGGYHICISVDKTIPADITLADVATECTALVTASATDLASTQALAIAVKTAGTIYARIAAHDLTGNVSVFSDEASASFDFLPPGTNTLNLTIRLK